MKVKLLFIFTLSLMFFFICQCARNENLQILKGPYLGQKPPGPIPDVFAPGIISHGFHEHNLTISPSGDEMLYSTASSDYKHYAIIHVKKENGVWTTPQIAYFSSRYSDMGPRFSPDGKKIFFCSKRPKPGAQQENSSYDLWAIEREAGTQPEPVHLKGRINTDKNEAFPSISTNGTIYYHFWGEKGIESDIYYSQYLDGEYQEPTRLEFGISTEFYEGGPYIAPDESYLLFQAIRPDSYQDNTNIYISFKNSDNTWTPPQNLGESVNASGYPISPMVSPDGKYLFFATNTIRKPFSYSGRSYSELIKMFKSHLNGYGTLWWMDAGILEEFKPGYRE